MGRQSQVGFYRGEYLHVLLADEDKKVQEQRLVERQQPPDSLPPLKGPDLLCQVSAIRDVTFKPAFKPGISPKNGLLWNIMRDFLSTSHDNGKDRQE